MAEFTKARQVPISEFGKESYIQQLLASDPGLLGLGELNLIGKERPQESAGRLDLLFESEDGSTWYEVEVQLRSTDETHIVRTIEYWDIERRRRPNKKHVAVLVAERITSRFYNVIGLFNQHLPIAAIQMQGYEIDGKKTIIFTTILNHSTQADEPDEVVYQPTDKTYWVSRTSPEIMSIAEEILGMLREKSGDTEFKYNKGYLKTSKGGELNNFLMLRPQKKRLRLSLLCPRNDSLDELIERSGYELQYDEDRGKYVLWIYPDDFPGDKEALRNIIHDAYELETTPD